MSQEKVNRNKQNKQNRKKQQKQERMGELMWNVGCIAILLLVCVWVAWSAVDLIRNRETNSANSDNTVTYEINTGILDDVIEKIENNNLEEAQTEEVSEEIESEGISESVMEVAE